MHYYGKHTHILTQSDHCSMGAYSCSGPYCCYMRDRAASLPYTGPPAEVTRRWCYSYSIARQTFTCRIRYAYLQWRHYTTIVWYQLHIHSVQSDHCSMSAYSCRGSYCCYMRDRTACLPYTGLLNVVRRRLCYSYSIARQTFTCRMWYVYLQSWQYIFAVWYQLQTYTQIQIFIVYRLYRGRGYWWCVFIVW